MSSSGAGVVVENANTDDIAIGGTEHRAEEENASPSPKEAEVVDLPTPPLPVTKSNFVIEKYCDLWYLYLLKPTLLRNQQKTLRINLLNLF